MLWWLFKYQLHNIERFAILLFTRYFYIMFYHTDFWIENLPLNDRAAICIKGLLLSVLISNNNSLVKSVAYHDSYMWWTILFFAKSQDITPFVYFK